MRRTLASELLDKTDPHTVQELLGHDMLETTMRYDRRTDTRKREAMELVAMAPKERA
jgi:integrase